MRIVWLANGNEGYGIARATLERMEQVRAEGHEVALCTLTSGVLTKQAGEMSMPTTVLGAGAAPGFGGGLLGKVKGLAASMKHSRKVLPQVMAALRVIDPEVVHIAHPTLLKLGGAAAKRVNAAAVWEIANSIEGWLPFELNRRIYQWVCNRHRLLPIANSRYTATTLGPTKVPAAVIFPATSTKRFNPQQVQPASRQAFGIPPDALLGVVCSRITPSKGQAVMVEALRQWCDGGQCDLRLIFVGGPGSANDEAFIEGLRAKVAAAGLEDRVVFAGASGEVERFYAMSDFSISFRIDPEPFGLSIIESMLMGKPVVVHALGGPDETVSDGVTGWKVRSAQAEALAEALSRVEHDRAGLAVMGEAARQAALEMFSREQQVLRYLEVVSRHQLARE
jgi:glycosyltransferase involved in cell wall biosynthesis